MLLFSQSENPFTSSNTNNNLFCAFMYSKDNSSPLKSGAFPLSVASLSKQYKMISFIYGSLFS